MPPPAPERRAAAPGGAVRIAGAGPAGLAAAVALAKAGREVEVHDARRAEGARWKRGFQIIENFSEREDVLRAFRRGGIATNFDARPIRRARLWTSAGRPADFTTARPFGYFVNRGSRPGDLDAGLLEQARAAGARVRFGSRLPEEDADVYAGGPRRADGMGKEATFRSGLSDRVSVILDPELCPGGYAYLFVSGGEATLGAAVLGDFGAVDAVFERAAERFARLEGLDYRGGDEGRLVANFFLKETLQRGRTRIVGEAAGFQDYLFGFGIRYAVESGLLAARSVLDGSSYDTLWRGTLKKRQEVSLFNRFFYETGRRWAPVLLVGLARRSGDLRSFLRGWYEPWPLKTGAAGLICALWRRRRLKLEVTREETGRAPVPPSRPQAGAGVDFRTERVSAGEGDGP